jgi:hypothetical protein
METNTAPTTLRERLIANSAILDDDPFAGDDVLWADEDWAAHATLNEDVGLRFWSGLLLGFAVSAIGWFALAGSAYLVYRFIT